MSDASIYFDRQALTLSWEQIRALVPYLIICVGLIAATVTAALKANVKTQKVILSVFMLIPMGYWIWELRLPELSVFGTSLVVNSLTRGVGILVAAFGVLAAWIYQQDDQAPSFQEWGPILLISVLGQSLLVGARDFISFFVYLETASISGYLLAAFRCRDSRSLEAGLKYLLLGGFSSALFLLGIAIFYGFSGQVSFEGVRNFVVEMGTDRLFVMVGLVLIMSAVAFKVALAPMHMWAPEIYSGASTGFAAFLASATKASVFTGAMVVLSYLSAPQSLWFKDLILVAGGASVLFGNLAAITQNKVKRMLAFSGVANAGYAVFALGVGSMALESLMTFLLIYGMTVAAAFAVIEAMVIRLGKPAGAELMIEDLPQIGRSRLSFVFAALMFSLAGIPPLPGFISKYLLIRDYWAAHYYAAAILVVLGSLLGLAYYLRILVPLYMTAADVDYQNGKAQDSLGGPIAKGPVIAVFASVVVLVAVLVGFSRFLQWVDYVEVFAR